jgi:hypothetical protein
MPDETTPFETIRRTNPAGNEFRRNDRIEEQGIYF